jgi:hypothetical protein
MCITFSKKRREMGLDRNKTYWFSAPKDPELSHLDLEFLEKPGEYAERVVMLRERGNYLEDRVVTVYDKPDGTVICHMWMSDLVADYHNK